MSHEASSNDVPLVKPFRTALVAAMPNVRFHEEREPEYILTFDSTSPVLGEMSVRIDTEEITVIVGPHHHTHISLYMFEDLGEAEALEETARAAVEYISDIFNDRRAFGVNVKDGRVVGSYDFFVDHEPVSHRAPQEYVWSGPLAR